MSVTFKNLTKKQSVWGMGSEHGPHVYLLLQKKGPELQGMEFTSNDNVSKFMEREGVNTSMASLG